jgi:hypothetical protein
MSSNKRRRVTFSGAFIVAVLVGMLLIAIASIGVVSKQSQLRTVVAEYDAVKTAIHMFNTQYRALPGDFPQAFNFWGKFCHSNKEKCNGDGDGVVELSALFDDNEVYRVWQHLSLANIYPGRFTGEGESAEFANGAVVGKNSPPSQYQNLLITLIYDDEFSHATAGNGAVGGAVLKKNLILFGSDVPGDVIANGTELSSVEVYSIDNKIDDSRPYSGYVYAVGSRSDSSLACTRSEASSEAKDQYYLEVKNSRACAIAFSF